MSAARPELRALARELGVADAYWDLTGVERATSDATREALLAAMGHDASDEALAARSREARREAARERCVEPVQVWRECHGSSPSLRIRLPRGAGAIEAELELEPEGGAPRRWGARLSAHTSHASVDLPIPGALAPGYYAVRVALSLAAGVRRAEQRLVVAPRSALRVRERIGEQRAFGIWANLYSLRSRRNQGIGDVSDLRELVRFCGRRGADFAATSPLHAIRNQGCDISPYSPLSRLYRNPLYLDLHEIPELAECAALRARLERPDERDALRRLREAREIDYPGVLALKLEALRQLHRAFAAGAAGSSRAAAYARYRAEEGELLVDFATFQAIEANLRAAGQGTGDWRRWPAQLRDPRGPGVAAFRAAHAEEVDFHCWLQFELERQLGLAAREAREAGLRIGIASDLAVGSAADSADTWMCQTLFAHGASLGAPPDAFAPSGQYWGLPPLDPQRLHADGYRFFSRMLRAAFRCAGALRIDHVMGVMRLFWIPEGRPGHEGTYVRQPTDELLGILALESRRAGALVIGEDLGTVPPELPELLASWGILSSVVLRFERDGERFRSPARYPSRALAMTHTHDLPPLPGFLSGSDLELRRRAGDLPSEAALASARAERAGERDALLSALREQGQLPPAAAAVAPEELVRAANAFLASTPAALVALSLDDLCGELEPVNLPGVPVEQHRSWSRRMSLPLEALESSAPVAHALLGAQARRRVTERAERRE